MNSKNKIILPLDSMDLTEAMKLVNKVKDLVWGFKVNDLLVQEGIEIIKKIKSVGANVMADLKLFDIPNTMNNSIKLLRSAGADIITVHALSNYSPMYFNDANKIAGVTILTSFCDSDSVVSFNRDTAFMVQELSGRCSMNNYRYLVCSPKDLDVIKVSCKKICPGIRPTWYGKKDDQHMPQTPSYAIKKGADLLVVGRPILNASDMIKAINLINEEIENAKS